MKNIYLSNFRAFEYLEMENLGQVNLIVGKKNSGKSSILEAINIISRGGDLESIFNSCISRGEQIHREFVNGRPMHQEADVSHLFFGHNINFESNFKIKSDDGTELNASIVPRNAMEQNQILMWLQNDMEMQSGSTHQLSVQTSNGSAPLTVPLTQKNGLRQDVVQLSQNIRPSGMFQRSIPQFITTNSFSAVELQQMWSSIVLTIDEDRVVNALKFLDPNIERVANINVPVQFVSPNLNLQRGNFLVKSKEYENPIPIGNYGDGVWRMLSLAIGLCKARNTSLLIDEIDTGLHFSAMSSMWKMIINAARELKVQVFATTHSYDCISSLASCSGDNEENFSDVAIFRVDKKQHKSVRYGRKQMQIAAQNNIEVR